MTAEKGLMMAQLRGEIRSLQGGKRSAGTSLTEVRMGGMENSFPGGAFPLSGVHEFMCPTAEGASASSGFIAGILSSLMKKGGVAVWIGPSRKLCPPALKAFGISPHHVLFINARVEADLLWVMEEALKCSGLAAAVGEFRNLSFNASRRLQLAVEGSGVPGFLLRSGTVSGSSACLTRWEVKPAASDGEPGLPGLGLPRWSVELLKVRNGTPASWQVEWASENFRMVAPEAIVMPRMLRKKIG